MNINLDLKISAIFSAAIINFVLGGLWYSPILFGKKFVELKGWSEAELKEMQSKGGHGKSYVWAFITALVMAFVLDIFLLIMEVDGFLSGALVGFLCGLGFVFTTSLATVTFEGRKAGFWLIQLSYYWFSLMVMGGLLAAWK